jgi:hypothetical protein
MEKELEKIFNELENALTTEQIQAFRKIKEEDLINSHFGLGAYIRNNYFWNRQKIYYLFLENGILHPDDMSNFLIKKFSEYLKKNEIKLSEWVYYFYLIY